MTSFVTWVLPYQRAGATDQLPTSGHGTAFLIYDAADIPIGLSVVPGTPPSITVYDKDDNPISIPLFPADITPEVATSTAATIDPNQAVHPGVQKSTSSTLKFDLYGLKKSLPATQSAPATALAPVIARSAKVFSIPAIQTSLAKPTTPTAFGPTSGSIAPAVVAASSSAITPRAPTHSKITKTPGVLASTATCLAPTLSGLGRLAFIAQKSSMSVLTPVITLAQNAAPAVLGATATCLAPFARLMGVTTKLPTTPGATTSTLTPPAVHTGGPPTFPTVTAAPAMPIAPRLVGAGSRAPAVAVSTSATLTPAKSMGPKTSTPASSSSAAAAIAPSITRTKTVAPAIQTSSATQPAIARVTERRAPATSASTSSALTPAKSMGPKTSTPALQLAKAEPLLPDVVSPHRYLKPATQISNTAAIAPAQPAFHALGISPAIATSSASTARGTLVENLVPADVVIEAHVATHIDYTEEHDVMQECQQSQAGIVFDVPMRDSAGGPLDLTGATQVHVWLRPPTGTSKQRAAAVLGEPTKGVVRYTTGAADFHEHGIWGVQVSAQLANGLPSWSSVVLLRVNPNIGPYGPQSSSPQATAVAGVLEPGIVFT